MPRVEDKQITHRGFINTKLLQMGSENYELVSLVAQAKVNVKTSTTNERGKQGRDFYFHMNELAVVHAKCITITTK